MKTKFIKKYFNIFPYKEVEIEKFFTEKQRKSTLLNELDHILRTDPWTDVL